MNLKGSLPLLILHILKEGPNHGYRIAKRIKRESSGVLDFKEGTLYPTLHSLEKQGMIESFHELENGRQRRYYRLTPKGIEVFADELQQWQAYAKAVNKVLKGAATS